MSRYYCPFCSPRYQIQKSRSDGVLICGQCGDPLMKKPLINSKFFFGLVVVSAFLAPLILMIIFVIKDFSKEKQPIIYEPLVLLTFK